MANLYILVGSPCSGKTWVMTQLKDKTKVLEHDKYINKDYTEVLTEELMVSPVVIAESPFSASLYVDTFTKLGHTVIPIYVISDDQVLATRYKERGKDAYPPRYISQNRTFKDRISKGSLGGDSSAVLFIITELLSI